MKKIQELLKRYKWTLIAGIIVAVIMGILTANIHIISFVNYRMKGNTLGIIALMSKDIKNPGRQDDWYFKEGIQYLAKEGTKESLSFFEDNLEAFIPEVQYDIIKSYNNKRMFFVKNEYFMKMLMEHLDNQILIDYLKRMEPKVLDEELARYYGGEPEVNTELITTLHKILSVYPKQLPLKYFKFDLYALLAAEDGKMEEQKDQIFSKLAPEIAREMIFKELKTKPVELKMLSRWIEFLNKHQILEPKDYMTFSNLYSELQVTRTRIEALEEKAVDFSNKKQEIELKIGDDLKRLETNQTEINKLKYETASFEKELEQLTDYAYMALYIDKDYGNGEYEASVPRKNLFGNYKASSQKYVIKLNSTAFYKEGVYYVDVYLKGTKINNKGEEYPYYVEVSKAETERIDLLMRSREGLLKEQQQFTAELGRLQKEVDTIKQEMGYNENEAQLKEIALEKESLINKLESKLVEIKTLFGIGNIIIEK